MRPAPRLYHTCASHFVIRCVGIGLQNAMKVLQKLFGPGTISPQAKVEHRCSSRSSVLPQICLMIFAATIVPLHFHRRLVGLQVAALHQLSTHHHHHGLEHFSYLHYPAVQCRSADLHSPLPLQNHALPVQRKVITILADDRVDHHSVTH